MEIETVSPITQPYTFLRIKRKRNEEPLDALVVESRVRRKKSRGGIGVFKFAQTVENDAWEDEKKAKDIRDEISRLARESSIAPQLPATLVADSTTTSHTRHKDDTRRYTVLHGQDPDDESARGPRPTCPPKVISSKELPPKSSKSDFRMYDAVLTTDKEAPMSVDSEMDKFLPMLNDYLKLHDVILDTPPAKEIASSSQNLGSQPNDYVWDVFYHRPATLSEWNAAANIGTLTGLPPSITNPYDSDTESEEEDEADEDSNAEEYYKNDYPEDDSSSSDSDEFHEHSENDDQGDDFE